LDTVETKEVQKVDVNPIEKKTGDLTEQAKAIAVTNHEQSVAAGALCKDFKAHKKMVNDTFNPMVDASRAAWKLTIAQRDGLLAPLVEGDALVKAKLKVYDDKLEAERQAEAKRLREEAARVAEVERQRLAEKAAKLKEEGRADTAATLEKMAEEVEVKEVSEPLPVAKAQGMGYRDNWKARVMDKSKIPIHYLDVNMPALNREARQAKGASNIPGVEFFNDKVPVTSG
jgi:hypothetical protein